MPDPQPAGAVEGHRDGARDDPPDSVGTDVSNEAEGAPDEAGIVVSSLAETDVLRLADARAGGWEGSLAAANRRRMEAALERLRSTMQPLDPVLDGRGGEPVEIIVAGDWTDAQAAWSVIDRRLTIDDNRPPRLSITATPGIAADVNLDMYIAFDLYRPPAAAVAARLLDGASIVIADVDVHDRGLSELSADLTAATGLASRVDGLLIGSGATYVEAQPSGADVLLVPLDGPIQIRPTPVSEPTPGEGGGADRPAPTEPRIDAPAASPTAEPTARDVVVTAADATRADRPTEHGPSADEGSDVTSRSAAASRRRPSVMVPAGSPARPSPVPPRSTPATDPPNRHWTVGIGHGLLVGSGYAAEGSADRPTLVLKIWLRRLSQLDVLTAASSYAKYHPLLRADLPADLDRPTTSYAGSLYDAPSAFAAELRTAIADGGRAHALASTRAVLPPRSTQHLREALAARGVQDPGAARAGRATPTTVRCPLPGGVVLVANDIANDASASASDDVDGSTPTSDHVMLAGRGGARIQVPIWLVDALAPRLDGEPFRLDDLIATVDRPADEVRAAVRDLLEVDVLEATR